MPQNPKYDASVKIDGIKLTGRIVLTPESTITYENCSEIEKQIQDAIQRSKTEIILDCKHIGLLDSAALEMLVETHTVLRDNGGAFKIVGLNEVCRDILVATRIINVLFVYKDINEAIKNNP